MSPECDLDAVLARLSGRPFAERVEALCETFLGVPYDLNPYGEGPRGRYDCRPALRFDAFNCITYVETVLALALGSRVECAAELLSPMRYRGGEVAFEKRCHWIVGDWTANNLSNGLLRALPTDPEDLCGVFRRTVDWADTLGRTGERVHRADVPPGERAALVTELERVGAGVPRFDVVEPYTPFERLVVNGHDTGADTFSRLAGSQRPVVVVVFGEANEHVGLALPRQGAWQFYHADHARPPRVVRTDLLGNLIFRHRFTAQVGFRLFGINADWSVTGSISGESP